MSLLPYKDRCGRPRSATHWPSVLHIATVVTVIVLAIGVVVWAVIDTLAQLAR